MNKNGFTGFPVSQAFHAAAIFEQVTDQGMQALSILPSLTFVDLWKCCNVTSSRIVQTTESSLCCPASLKYRGHENFMQ